VAKYNSEDFEKFKEI